MSLDTITRAAPEYARPQSGPVTRAISTMRSAELERVAVATLRTALLRRLADDLSVLDRLDAIAARLALR